MGRHTREPPGHWLKLSAPRCICGLLSYQHCISKFSFEAAQCLSGPTHRGRHSLVEATVLSLRKHTHDELRAPNVGQRSVSRSQAALSSHVDRSPAWRTRTLHQMKVDPERLDLHIMATSSCRWGSARWKCRPSAGLYTREVPMACHLWD